MISTYLVKHPPEVKPKPLNLGFLFALFVVPVLGYQIHDSSGLEITGLLTFASGILGFFFFRKGKKKAAVKSLREYDLHLSGETIVIGAHTYPVSELRSLHLNVGHYDGEPTIPKKGVAVALEGLEIFTGGGAGKADFYDGTDSRLSFLSGGTKVSVAFYMASAAQRAQFSTLLKVWYAAGIDFQEFSGGLRTYLGKQLNYAEIQAFKERFGLKEQQFRKKDNLKC